MVSPLSISLSGLVAAQTRLGVSADNTANVRSAAGEENGAITNRPYVPQEVTQSAAEPQGGTTALTRPVADPTIAQYEPESPLADQSGVVQYPNVDLAQEAINQKMAVTTYKANLNVIKAYDEMQQSLLDISG
jgi:flagellar basal-body rod protein FlgC